MDMKANAYYMRGALPTVEQSRDEYTGSVFGSAALAYITIIHTTDALDMLPVLVLGESTYKNIRRYANRLLGTKTQTGEIRKLEINMGDLLAHDCDRAWVADFGNAVYEKVQPYTYSLQVAIANALGRYNVPDINVCAAILVAQSLASEAVSYVKRRAKKFANYSIVMRNGYRQSVSSCLNSMSCDAIEFCLRKIAFFLIEKELPHDVDLVADPSVNNGLKSVMNILADVNTWIYAREKANKLNNVK